MELILKTPIPTSLDFLQHGVGSDHHEPVYEFSEWYRCYRHASDKVQVQMEYELELILTDNPDLVLIRDRRGDLPVHHILAEDHGSVAPVPIGLLKTLLRASPDSIRMADGNGLLPLHLACRYGGYLSYDTIHCLIDFWPEALQKMVNLSKSKSNMLPLHIACEFGPLPSNIIKLLAEKYPEALMMRNGEGNLPLHIACRGYNVSPNTIKFLYKSYPGSILVPNDKGELPLHIVCGRRSINALDTIKVLLHAYPESIRSENVKGELPLHYACNGYQPLNVIRFLVSRYPGAVQASDIQDMLPIHHACKTNVPVLDVIDFLVTEYPESLTRRDHDGFLPLHYACRYGSYDIIKMFVDVNPESVKDSKNTHGLLPIQIICKNKNPSPAIAKILGSAYPESMRSFCIQGEIPLNIAKAYYSSESFEYCPNEVLCGRMDLCNASL